MPQAGELEFDISNEDQAHHMRSCQVRQLDASQSGSAPDVARLTGERLANAQSESHNWPTYYGAYDAQRFSALEEWPHASFSPRLSCFTRRLSMRAAPSS
jgi:hypothetical protein